MPLSREEVNNIAKKSAEAVLGCKCEPIDFKQELAKALAESERHPEVPLYQIYDKNPELTCTDSTVHEAMEFSLKEEYTPPGMGDWGRLIGNIKSSDPRWDFSQADCTYRISWGGGKSRPTAYIEHIFVAPSLQRKGLGKWLVEQIESRAESYKAKEIGLMDHEESGKFWPALGYKPVGDSPYFRKKL